MRKRVISLIILSLISVMIAGVLSSCNSLLDITHSNSAYAFFDENTEENFSKEKEIHLTELTNDKDIRITNVCGILAYAQNSEGDRFVYNLETQKQLYITKRADTIIKEDSAGFIVIQDSTLSIYDPLGIIVYGTKNEKVFNEEITHYQCERFISFDRNYFKIQDDGSLKNAGPVISKALLNSVYFEDHFYYMNENDMYIIFDSDGNIVASHKPYNSASATTSTFILSNGNLAIQTKEKVTDESADFSYIDNDGIKYNLSIYLLKPNAKFAIQISTKFLIEYSTSEYYHDISSNTGKYTALPGTVLFNKDCLVIRQINKDKTLSDPEFSIVIPEKLSILSKFSDLYEYSGLIYPLSENYFLTIVGNDTAQILNVHLKCVAQGNIDTFSSTNKYIIHKDFGCIYDLNIDVVFDYYENDYTLYGTVGNNVLLSKNDIIYLFSGDSTLKRIGKTEQISIIFGDIIVVKDKAVENIYNYYDSDMNSLFSSKSGPIKWFSLDLDPSMNNYKTIGYTVDSNGNYKNYLLTIELN